MYRFVTLLCLGSVVAARSITKPDPHDVPESLISPRGVAYDSPWTGVDWTAHGLMEIENAIQISNSVKNTKAKNVILFIGDGMGVSTVSSARLYHAQLKGLRETDTYLSFEKLPHVGLSRTYNVDRSTPDSAGTGTAYMCGVKGNYETIGVNENVQIDDCPAVNANKVRSILKNSVAAGKWTGVVTTTRVTHASPAAAYAHVANRDWEGYVPTSVVNSTECADIAAQMVDDSENQQMRVILGGGRQMFIPNTVTDPEFPTYRGQRRDGRDLIQIWLDQHVANGENAVYAQNKNEFDAVDIASTDYLMGLFFPSHMDYEIDRTQRSPIREPSLTEMTQKAIDLLSKSTDGFFLFVEGGRIDHAHHDTRAQKALNDTLAFADAIQRATEITNPDETLIIVSADHSHVYTFGGYSTFQQDVLGFSDGSAATDGKPYTQLHYANGPGYYYHRQVNGTDTPRKDLTDVDTLNPMYQQDAAVPIGSETHGGEDVGIYASGPMSHLVHGQHEQTHIAHVMMYASCVGQYSDQPHCGTIGR